jgi:hypothetical protein
MEILEGKSPQKKVREARQAMLIRPTRSHRKIIVAEAKKRNMKLTDLIVYAVSLLTTETKNKLEIFKSVYQNQAQLIELFNKLANDKITQSERAAIAKAIKILDEQIHNNAKT